MQEKIVIFANPIAGRGQGKVLARKLETELSAEGFSVRTHLDRPTELDPEDLSQPPAVTISIGGDGTLRGVVNLFYKHHPNGPAIVPVPLGTANLMSWHLGNRWPPGAIIEGVINTIHRRKIIRLDAGRANGRLFLLMAGIGIDAHIVHLLDQMRRGPIDMTSYLLPAAMTFAAWTFPPITVSLDEHIVLKNTPAIAMIGNVREYGLGVPILPDAVPDDGLLDVCVLPCHDRGQLIEILTYIAAGEHTVRDDVIYTTAKRVKVESKEKVAIQVDGDSAGFTPLNVDLLPAHVPFLVPV